MLVVFVESEKLFKGQGLSGTGAWVQSSRPLQASLVVKSSASCRRGISAAVSVYDCLGAC